MIERVIGAFRNLGFDLDDTEIADILWLSLQMRRSQSSPLPQLQQQTPGSTPEITPTQLPINQNKKSQKSSSKTETSANVYPQPSQDSNQTSSGLPIKVPTAQALRNQLAISRSLKPLKRRVPSKNEFILDEAATAERIAEEKLLLPVMRPAPERWLELALVIDEGASMMLWKQTIKEFKQLLERHGAFRDVRTWGLFISEDSKVWLRSKVGSVSRQKKLHNPRELIDPNGRRLFVIISDCVSPAWRNGTITKALVAWASTSPMTIIQVLPEWLWERSALGVADSILLRSLAPGVPNQQLIMTALDLLDESDVVNKLKVPVVTLEPESLKNWAWMVAGAGDVQTKGFLLALDAEVFDIDDESTENYQIELSAKQRLQRFRLTASPMARKLAGLLAAAPVSLPVVRLIRQTMLPQSSQVHVAEVFLGGILKPLSPIDEGVEADKIQYDFVDGVRDLLLDAVPLTESTKVLRMVSEYVVKGANLSINQFTAMLANPGLAVDDSSGVLVRPFAQVTAKVLSRLGGKYTELAEDLEQSSEELSETDTSSIQELINDLDHEDSDIRKSAIEALGKIGNEKAVNALIYVLDDEDSDNRRIAAELLGEIGNETAVKDLITALDDEDLFVRKSVIKALGNIGSGKAANALIYVLDDEDSDNRRIAAELLGEIGNETSVEYLVIALDDEDLDVRKSVAKALGEIGNQAAVNALINILDDDDINYTVAQAIGEIDTGNKQLNKVIQYLYKKLDEDAFIELISENYDYFEDIERLLSVTCNEAYLDFESFVELAIQTLKPDFDGNVYVKYERYYSTHDEGERYVGSLGQEADLIHLSHVPEFITGGYGESLGVMLEDEQKIEIVLSILDSGEYELPDSDIEGGTVEISIKEPELLNESYEEYENYVDFGETVEPIESSETELPPELDDKLTGF
ncbi:MAG: SAV_2336 N-terminal domain-related protein [Rivularia sp. (in: cyanobacteria)]